MLRIANPAHFEKVVTFACDTGQAELLFEQLLWLHRFADPEARGDTEVAVHHDFAPASFYLIWSKPSPDGAKSVFMNGGLIYHGDQTGWRRGDGTAVTAPVDPCAVRLCKQENPWSVHT